MIGTTLNNRYTVTAKLGKGAMGTVYRAADSQAGNEVALKVIARDLALDPELIERFKREAEALRQLQHPNIVGFVDAFQHGEQYVIAMEYVPGGSLHELIKKGPLPVDYARQLALDLCDALIRAHRLNIIHRDIKPENVLLAADGTPKLTDFGVARLVSEGTRLTGTGTQVGTPFYMSPEAWEGKPLDAQADIWSLGVVLYEMLSGEVPFGGETLVAVMNKVLSASLSDLKTKRPDIPDGLAQIIACMLTRDKAARYRSMREVAADLERGGPATATAPQPITAPVHAPATKKVPAEKTPAAARAHNGLAIIAVILSLLGAFTGPALLLFATENYLKGPLWVVAALALTAALVLGWWGLQRERAEPSRWGRLEAGLGVGIGGLAIVAFVAVGLTVAPRLTGGGGLPIGLSPSATSTAIAVAEGTLGSILFEDNFDNGFSPRWEFQPQRWETATVDGRTVLRNVPAERDSFASVSAEGWADYAAQFDFRFLKPGTDNGYSLNLRFRWSECPPNVPAVDNYVAAITTDTVELRDERCETQRQERLTMNDHNLSAEDWHTAQVVAIGNRLRLWIDGEQYFDYTDTESPHLNGGVWLYVENNLELAIDNFRVTEIIPNAAPSNTGVVSGLDCAPGQTKLFADDFEDGDTQGWSLNPAEEGGAVNWAVETESDGNHILTGVGHQWAVAGDPNWRNYVVRVRVRRPEEGNAVFHLNAYLQTTRYLFIFPAGNLAEGTTSLDILAKTNRLPQDNDWHTLALSVANGRIEAILDGEVVASANNSKIDSGNIGLENLSGTVWYDDVVVCSESGEQSAASPEEIAAFADPILAAIASRAPDYEDDFSDSASGWPSGPNADGSETGYKDGAYFISGPYLTLPDLDHCVGAAPDPAPRFSDFVLEIEARFASGEWGNWYTILRESPGTIERPTSAHYGVQFYPDGAGRVYKNVGGTDITLGALAFEQGLRTNHLTVIARGPQIAVYMNGEPLGLLHDESSSKGTIHLGLCNEAEDTILEVQFDNLKIWDISELP